MTTSPIDLPIKSSERSRPVSVIGIGSPHGDDRAGWKVIDRLVEILSMDASRVFLGKASVPHDILDWLELHSTTHIIDACSDRAPGFRRFPITQDASNRLRIEFGRSIDLADTKFVFDSLSSNSTHQFGLLPTLELAAALGRLPSRLYLWTVSIASVEKNADVRKETQTHIDECVAAIMTEL